MKISMLTTYAGPLGCFQPGQDPPIPDNEKKALVSGGFAKSLDDFAPVVEKAPVIETATVKTPENAAINPKPKPAGRQKK
jgi:hypothetical protein